MKIIFSKETWISFGDADPQGILYYPRALDLAHTCLEEFWKGQRVGWKFWFQNPEFAVPIRHAECDFLSPLYVGENYQVRLGVSTIGESSVEFVCEILSSQVCVRVRTVHVFVDRKTFQKISVPEPVRELLSEGLF